MARRTAGARRWEPDGPDPRGVLERLHLTTGRAARLCGVTRRQLCYWTDQGFVQAVAPNCQVEGENDDGQRLYDCAALEKILLMKQSLARGRAVRRAAEEAEAQIREQQRQAERLAACSPQERQPFLAEQADRLDRMAQQLQRLALTRDRTSLVGLAAQLQGLGEVCEEILQGGTAMHEDAAGCLGLAAPLERLEAALAETEDPSP